jgi:outer membrane protein assembly factor BamB
MQFALRVSLCFTLLAVLSVRRLLPADWRGFRGPGGSGVSEVGLLPQHFGPQQNLVWRATVPPGASSPIVVGRRVLVTSAETMNRMLICLDQGTGKILWKREVQATRPHHRHPLNDAASPTPVSDGTRVYVFYPEYGLIAYDLEGHEVWKSPLGPFVSLHGIAASPVLAEGQVITLVDQARDSFIASFSSKDGRQLWKSPRPDAAGGYSTPVVYLAPNGRSQIIVSSPRELAGYSAMTGEKMWWFGPMGEQPQTSPIVFGDFAYAVGFGGAETWEQDTTFRELDRNHDDVVDQQEFPDSWGGISGSVLDGNGDGF